MRGGWRRLVAAAMLVLIFVMIMVAVQVLDFGPRVQRSDAEVVPRGLPARPPDRVLQDGEELRYRVHCRGADIGTGHWTATRADDGSWLVTLQVRSANAVQVLYPVIDEFRSRLAAATGFPSTHDADIDEGGRHRLRSWRFAHAQERLLYKRIKYRDDGVPEVSQREWPMPESALCPLSWAVYLRAEPELVGFAVPFASKHGIAELTVTAARPVQWQSPVFGTRDALELDFSLLRNKDGLTERVQTDGQLHILLDAHTRVPVCARMSRVPVVGEVVCELVGAEKVPGLSASAGQATVDR